MTLASTLSRRLLATPLTARRLTSIALATPKSTKPSVPGPTPEALAARSTSRPHHVILTLAGEDRPGIVSKVTAAISSFSANLEQSRMAVLGGDFAMIVHVSLPAETDGASLSAVLRDKLPHFSLSMRETTPPPADVVRPPVAQWRFSLEAADQPGVVAALSNAFALNGCNVEDMETDTVTAPFAGYPLLSVSGRLTLADAKLDALSADLDKIEDRFGSTIALSQEPSYEQPL